MILSFLIIAILIAAFAHGYRRGFLKQLIFTLGNLVVLFIAWRYNAAFATGIGSFLGLFSSTFVTNYVTHIFSFYLILFVGHLFIFWLAKASKVITWIPIIHQSNGLAGGILALLFMYFGLFIALWTLQILPVDSFHQLVANSPLAQWITTETPILTKNLIQNLFHFS